VVEASYTLCCGVRSKRNHSIRNNGTTCDAAFCHLLLLWLLQKITLLVRTSFSETGPSVVIFCTSMFCPGVEGFFRGGVCLDTSATIAGSALATRHRLHSPSSLCAPRNIHGIYLVRVEIRSRTSGQRILTKGRIIVLSPLAMANGFVRT